MPALSYLLLTSGLACQTPTVYGVLHPEDLTAASDVLAVEDQESLAFRYARVDATGAVRPITAQLRAGRVVRVVWSDGAFDEWRVGTVTTGRGEGGLISVACVPLWLDLVERADTTAGKGWVSDVSAGVRNFEYEITERTPSSILSTYVIPYCPSYVTLGTVDPTYVIPSFSVSRLTPGALALAVRDALRAVDVSSEVRLRRNGTTDYKLDLVTEIGASGNTPVFHPSVSLLSLTQKSDPTLQATRVLVKGGTAPDGLPGIWGRARWRGAAPSGSAIVLTDRNGGARPVAFDNQFVGMRLLRVKTGRTFPITASATTTGAITATGVSTSTIAVDEDFEFRVDEPLTNTRTTTTRFAVSAVPDATSITCGVSAPITITNQFVDWYARVWSAAAAGTIIITTRISASVAATDVLTVASSAGVNNMHYVEFIQLDGAGEVPSVVDHPTYVQADPTGYGVKAMELSKQAMGVVDLAPNAWMRTWTNSANPPDGWVVTGTGTGTSARNATAAYTRYGGYSWQFLTGNASYGINTPPTYLTDDRGFVSARAWVYFTVFTADSWARFLVYARTASGGIGALLGEQGIMPLDSTLTGYVKIPLGAWIELKIEGIPVSATLAPYGIAAGVWPFQGAFDARTGYVDVIEIYGFATCPNDVREHGDAQSLLQSANNALETVAPPPLYYTLGIRDLERAFPAEYARLALTLGANVRAADVEYGIDATVRLLSMRRDLLDASRSELTLANRPTRLTTVQSSTAVTAARIIAAVKDTQVTQSGGTAFVALTAATTLTQGAEISTPAAGAPVVTLPSGTSDAGASVTFVPANPATTPQTTVTVGTPPSRARKIIPL